MQSLNLPPDYEPTPEEREGSNKATRLTIVSSIISAFLLFLYFGFYYGTMIINYLKQFIGL